MSGPDLTLLRKALAESDFSSLYNDRTIDQMLVHLMDYKNPLRQMIQRRNGSGFGVTVRQRTPGTTAATDLDDTDSVQEQTGTPGELNYNYKTLATQGRVSRKSQKTGKLISDILADEIEGKTKELKDAEDWRMIWGNSPTVNTKQITGLHYHMTQHTGQIVALTNSSVGVAITTENLDQALDLITSGEPGLIVTSRAGRRKINALLQSGQRWVDRVEVPGGFKVISYNGVPILTSTNIPDTLQISTGGTITSLTGGSTTALFVLDLAQVYMSVLTEVTMMPLARSTSQYELFDIFEDIALVNRDYRGISCITGWKAR